MKESQAGQVGAMWTQAGPWVGAGAERASGRAPGGRPLWSALLAFCRCRACSTFSLKRRFFCLIDLLLFTKVGCFQFLGGRERLSQGSPS